MTQGLGVPTKVDVDPDFLSIDPAAVDAFLHIIIEGKTIDNLPKRKERVHYSKEHNTLSIHFSLDGEDNLSFTDAKGN